MSISGSTLAYKYALSGVLRSGSGRSNYTDPRLFVSIGGVQYATGRATSSERVMQGTLSISESNGDGANTCTFQVIGFAPTVGQEVIITLGSRNNADRQFAGNIQNVTTGYVGSTAFATHTVSAIDYSWQLTRKKVAKRYSSQSATAIAQDLIAQVAGFTAVNVAAGLASIDEISFSSDTVLSALTQLANRIGGFVKVDYLKDVHFALTDTSGTAPVSLTSANQTADAITFTSDLTHVITRAYEEGGGSNALGSVTAGDTILPVEDASWYGGGLAVCGPQKVTYTTVDAGGGGSLVGPGIGPAAAPSLIMQSGSGVETGTHLYAYTYITGAGESLPSPTASLAVGSPAADPSVAPVAGYSNFSPTGGAYPFASGDHTRLWAYTWVTAVGESLPSPTYDPGIDPLGGGGPFYAYVANIAVGPAGTTKRRVYRTVAGGAQLKLVAEIANNTTTSYEDHTVDGSLGANVPVANTTAGNHVGLTSVATGGTGVTSRKVYRTAAGGSQLKLLTTIGDNTTTTYTDSTADASLGANAPTSDTSGLAQPSGQVLAGVTSLPLAGAGAFTATGGWAVIGNGQQVIRYTGISGNSLTGVPASGTGAVMSTVTYGSSVTAAPYLAGIPSSGTGAILYNIAKGDPVNILVQVDDLSAQTVLAALIGGGDDGIIESYQRDGRISELEATARAQATLLQHSAVDVALAGNSRDLNMRAGRDWVVSVTAPMTVSQTFVVQSVTISNFQTAIPPTRTVTAGAAKVSFGDVILFVQSLTR